MSVIKCVCGSRDSDGEVDSEKWMNVAPARVQSLIHHTNDDIFSSHSFTFIFLAFYFLFVVLLTFWLVDISGESMVVV